MDSLPVTLATTLLVVVLVFLIHIISIKRAKSEKNRKPPQAKGAWPIIGHLHFLGGSQLPHKVLGDMADKHGPIFTIKLGVHQALVVSNGEMAKDCFTTNDKAFASRPKSEASRLMAYNYALFGGAPYGDYWRKVRKIIMLEVLSQRRVELLGHIRVSELKASINNIYEAWVNNRKSGTNSDMVKVEMSHWFGTLIFNIVVRIIYGKRFSPKDEEGIHFQMVVREYFKLFGAFVVSDFMPYLKFLDIGGYDKSMKKMGRDLDNIFEGWLKEHKIEKGSQENEGNQVFIDVLINIIQGASEGEFPDFDNDTIIKSTCQQLLTAGIDTTSVTLTWALSLLLNNPFAIKIAQDELDEHVGRDRLVEQSDIKNLAYLDAIIKETFRLYPAGPLSVAHESTEDCIVGGYNVPKGTRLVLNIWKLHRDPNVWSDPDEFRPERFLTSHKDIDVKGNHFELLPFGSGRRMCPAVFFSVQALGLTLASLLQQFDLKTPSNELVDMTETSGMTNNKATPLEVLLAPRLSPNMYHHEL
ncbi:cytochrome P450 82A4 [Artemisia annua]|uniref:Cytochrome P450 82A4 n=1 Tax=Artemisia annua TaxID=35608 RepID=A0A2U1PEW1_ARTAN|nr:cytochrome P450 82A4 [Artemisia annua]